MPYCKDQLLVGIQVLHILMLDIISGSSNHHATKWGKNQFNVYTGVYGQYPTGRKHTRNLISITTLVFD